MHRAEHLAGRFAPPTAAPPAHSNPLPRIASSCRTQRADRVQCCGGVFRSGYAARRGEPGQPKCPKPAPKASRPRATCRRPPSRLPPPHQPATPRWRSMPPRVRNPRLPVSPPIRSRVPIVRADATNIAAPLLAPRQIPMARPPATTMAIRQTPPVCRPARGAAQTRSRNPRPAPPSTC
ncbi:hypothetical protein D3C87_1483970 [compost metagenome]